MVTFWSRATTKTNVLIAENVPFRTVYKNKPILGLGVSLRQIKECLILTI